MKISVRLLVHLRQYCPENTIDTFDVSCNKGAIVSSFLKLLNIPASEQTVILVNGRHSEKDTKLSDGDLVTIYPPVAGG